MELGWAVVSYMGFGRLIHAFGIRPEVGDASDKRP